MKFPAITFLALHLALASVAGAGPTNAARGSTQTSLRLVLGRDLTIRQGKLRSIDAESISLVEPGGKVVVLALRDVVAVTMPPTHQVVVAGGHAAEAWRDASLLNETPQGLLELVDGQSIPGLLATDQAGTTKSDESIRWVSRQMAEISLPLESLRSIVLRPMAGVSLASSTGDVVYLTNGDRVEGFVASIGTSTKVEVQGSTSAIETSRIAAIRFANPPKRTDGMWVWLGNGTVLAARKVRIAEEGKGELVVNLPGIEARPIPIEAGDIRAIAFETTRVVPLAACTLRVEGGSAERRWTPPPVVGDSLRAPLGAADIELPGPMTVLFDVPAMARASGLVELPENCRVWGDCEVYIELRASGATKPLWHQRLNDAQPSASFNLVLPAASDAVLSIRVDAGVNGPIMDRVVLRRPILLRE